MSQATNPIQVLMWFLQARSGQQAEPVLIPHALIDDVEAASLRPELDATLARAEVHLVRAPNGRGWTLIPIGQTVPLSGNEPR